MKNRWARLGLFMAIIVIAGCAVAREAGPEVSHGARAGIVYGLVNGPAQGEIVGTVLYKTGATEPGRIMAVLCNGHAKDLVGDQNAPKGSVYLYGVCHKSATVFGFLAPSRPVGYLPLVFLGVWKVGPYDTRPVALALTPDGRFLYVGNGNGTVRGFRVGQDGRLEEAGGPKILRIKKATRVNSLSATPDGRRLVVSWTDRASSYVSLFRIDRRSGALRAAGPDVPSEGSVEGLVAPETLESGNILAGITQKTGEKRTTVVLLSFSGLHGTRRLTVRRFPGPAGTPGPLVFDPTGLSLYVFVAGGGDCPAGTGEIRRYSVGEYGSSLSRKGFACGPGGGGPHNAGWDREDRLLFQKGVYAESPDCDCGLILSGGRVQGDDGLVFVHRAGK